MSKHHKPGRRPAFGPAGTGPDYVVDSSPTVEREPSTETEPRNAVFPMPDKESDA